MVAKGMQDRKTVFEKTSLHPPFFGYASPLKPKIDFKIFYNEIIIQFLYTERLENIVVIIQNF